MSGKDGGAAALAFDLGAGSGRAVIGRLRDGRLEVTEAHRFDNEPVRVGDRLHWDILRLYHEVKRGIWKAHREAGEALQSVGIDSWAVDFGLIDKNGELLANPFHYRDHHTDGVMEEVTGRLGKERIFAKTGIQFLPFNTIYQLAALKKNGSVPLANAEQLLMIPDLLRYFLTGRRVGEQTNASTTQLLNANTGRWDGELLAELGIPESLMPDIVPAGTAVGTLRPQVCEELGVPPLPVIAVGEHDTASAVAAVPAPGPSFAYLSSGTWSLMGTELKSPILGGLALDWNFTNEGGVFGTYRLLKNIMGLWLLQECRRIWELEGQAFSFGELVRLADEAAPFRSLVDPDDPVFLAPPHMPEAIRQYCRNTHQPVPETAGEIVRCILESLALKYRLVLERTEKLAQTRFDGLHIVGGGIHNETLCQFTANAIGRPVWAGPAEGSAIGNLLVQFIAQGRIGDLQEARAIVGRSFPVRTYEPERSDEWADAYKQFLEIVGEQTS